MADTRQDRTRATNTAAVDETPKVEVYDNNPTIRDEPPHPSIDERTTVTSADRPEMREARGGWSWATILLVLLIVVALILLVMWLF